MRLPRFSILQLMLFMLICCVVGAALRFMRSDQGEASPLIFLLILLVSPPLLLILMSCLRAFTQRR